MGRLRGIHAISLVPFGPNTPFTRAAEIDLEEEPVNTGGFGAVYRILSVDGRSVEGALVKVMFNEQHAEHAYKTVHLLHKKLRGRFRDVLTTEYPELLGMPFLLFRAVNDDDEPVVAMALCDLTVLGFEDMGSDAWDGTAYFRDIGPVEKLHLAYQFARTSALLEDIGFIHADLKDKSIFLHTAQPQLALIDFDSGFHPETQGAASTLGALGQWAGRMLRGWVKNKQNPGQLTIEERQDEERWALASGVFELLSGVAPYFFLKDADDASIDQYLKEHKWPEIDPTSALVNPANLPYHEALVLLLQEFEESGGKDLVDAFKRTFHRGYYKPAARLKPQEWKDLLGKMCDEHMGKPIISPFQGDRNSIRRKGEEVILTWSAHQHRAVLLDGKPLPFGASTFTVAPSDTTVYTLQAINDFGIAESTFKVKAIKVPPVIHSFTANKLIRETLEPIVLEWTTVDVVEVRVVPVGGTAELNGTIEVFPVAPTTYELHAFGGFGQLAVATVQVDVIVPVIETFDWAVNLLEGIDNVDLKWKVQHGQEVTIEEVAGTQPAEGLMHVPIRNPTTFTLTVKGLFGSTSASLMAFPFPVPVIEQMRLEYPLLDMTTHIQMPAFNLEDILPDPTFLFPGPVLDPALLTNTPETVDLAPGYLRDGLSSELDRLNHWHGHWLLSGRAIWDRITRDTFRDND